MAFARHENPADSILHLPQRIPEGPASSENPHLLSTSSSRSVLLSRHTPALRSDRCVPLLRLLAAAGLAGFVGLTGSGCGPEHASRTASAPAYVGREVCSGCHAEAALAWKGSDHDRAMEEARPETVLGDFDDAVFRHCGVETRFFREGDGFFIHTQGTDGTMQTYPVAYTFGYEPLQQYLIPLENGRLQAFTVAWDTQGERWFSLAEDECITPPDWLHWTGDGMNWNYMCADCHSTNLQRNFNLAAGAYETSFSEIDVSCETCHGPGEAHVQKAQSGTYDSASSGLTATLSAPHQQVETCAPCHSRRRIVYPNHIAGNVFLDHYEPELLEEELYFADGQIRDEVYVYGSFLQSQMYAEGVVCADCHDPHTTRLKFEGNALCGQCHEATTYDTFEHIRHPQESEGAQCVDCHMPERTYMVVDPRRDHSFKIPRPDLSARTGAPNVCQGCHADRSAEWAAERIDDWHGPERPPSFATALAGGREGAPGAEPELIRLMEDHTAPDIVRATVLTLLDRYATVRASEAAIKALGDEAPLVRAAAVRRLGAENRGENDRSAIPKLEPLLTDPVGLVRMEAARVLARIAPERYARDNASETATAWRNALQEYRDGQYALNDQAASHLNLAILHEHLGQSDSAAAAYRTAVRIDSTFVPAHLNLAMLLNRMRAPGGADAGCWLPKPKPPCARRCACSPMQPRCITRWACSSPKRRTGLQKLQPTSAGQRRLTLRMPACSTTPGWRTSNWAMPNKPDGFCPMRCALPRTTRITLTR